MLSSTTELQDLMLLELAQWLAEDIRAFNVFGYITLRAVLATLTALVISFIVGPLVIRRLTAYKIGQSVRDDGPQTHLTKAGTPTMGGALILISIGDHHPAVGRPEQSLRLGRAASSRLGFGARGLGRRLRKVVHRNPKGLSARAKFFWQSVVGLSAAHLPAASSATRAGADAN